MAQDHHVGTLLLKENSGLFEKMNSNAALIPVAELQQMGPR